MVADAVMRVGVAARADHPTRVVILRVPPHPKRRLSKAAAAKPPTEIRLVTNLLDLPAELIALISQYRWTIEKDQTDCTSSDRWCVSAEAGYDRCRRAA